MATQVKHASEIYPGVIVDPRISHGVPVLAGTRIPVQLILGHLAAGDSIEDVTEAYDLTAEQVRAALGYAADRVGAERVYAVPGA